MKKQIIAVTLTLTIMISAFPARCYATESSVSNNSNAQNIDSEIIDETSANAAGSARTVEDVMNQWKFSQKNGGKGFAAERGNHLIDRIRGNNAKLVGDNNVKNGPDREIFERNGKITRIQDKYYADAGKAIDECFENGKFKYIDGDGNLMQIEVPKDQYDKAVQRMQTKIKNGEVPGVTDPNEANKIVRKGNLTFNQAKNLAKAGTVESLKYDAANGIVASGYALGISTLLNYAACRIRGDEPKDALKTSAIEGVKSGAGVFCTAVIAGQLAKTGAIDIFKPSTEALTKALGKDFSESLIKAFGQKVIAAEGESFAESATKQAARLIRSQVLVSAVATIVFTVPDAVDMFQGRISKKQFIKNFAVTALSVAAGTAGYAAGGALGNLVVPGLGTFPGSLAGSILAGTGGALVADKIADYITDDDAEEMYKILQVQFEQYCDDYLVTEEEANNILTELNKSLNDDTFKDMYKSKDREAYATQLMEPLFEAETKKRAHIDVPSEEEMRNTLMEELDGIIFIH